MRVGDKSTHKWTAEGEMIISLLGEHGKGRLRVGDKSTHKWTAEGDRIISLLGEQGRGG